MCQKPYRRTSSSTQQESQEAKIRFDREQPQYYLTEVSRAFACNPLSATIRRWIKTGVKFGLERPVKLE